MKTIKDIVKDVFDKYKSKEHIKILSGKEHFDDVSYGYGSDWFEITKKQFEALKAGKILHIPENGGEYQMFIRLKKEEK